MLSGTPVVVVVAVVVGVSETYWLQAITCGENVFGEDGPHPRRGVEAQFGKNVFLFSPFFLMPMGYLGGLVRLDETDRGATAH